MRDRRPVDELSIEELEAVLRLRKREARLERLRQRPGEPEGRDLLVDQEAGSVESPAAAGVAAPRSVPAQRYSAVIQDATRAPRHTIRWGWVWNRFLLVVEILAVLGLVAVTAQMLMTVQALNEESGTGQPTPTLTPTPLISVAILPGGHTPPDAQGTSQPAAIPVHLQHLVEEITPLPLPTPGPEHAQRIVISGIAVDAPVVEGDDWESLKKGAGHHVGSANPGERGNCVISAHNDIYGEIFRELPSVKVGDEILVYTLTQTYRYVVQQTRIIEPTEVSVMAATNTPVLTLISCYPYGVDTHRIVVIAALES
ncbi:MAG: class D sortase [Anaerolineae bacterium]|jgi:sortase A|nr:class D sortase [Anaerolineae bacterium]